MSPHLEEGFFFVILSKLAKISVIVVVVFKGRGNLTAMDTSTTASISSITSAKSIEQLSEKTGRRTRFEHV